MKKNLIQKYPLPILEPTGNSYLYYKGNWEGRWVYHAKIVERLGKYYLFYSGKSGINLIGNIPLQMRQDIGVVISSDLKKWQRFENNPILSPGLGRGDWDNGLVCHGYILKVAKNYYMFYDGSSKDLWKESIGLAVSQDLKNWKRVLKNPVLESDSFWWDTHHVSRCCVIKGHDNYYYMFFAGHNGKCERIGIAKSKDLKKWNKFIKEPVINLGAKGSWDETFVSDPKVLKIDKYYLMSYTGYKGNRGCTGLAYSKDLINWRRFPLNPILEPGENSDWDSDEAARSDFVKIDDNYYLFYTGKKGFFYSLGYARVNMKEVMKEIKRDDR